MYYVVALLAQGSQQLHGDSGLATARAALHDDDLLASLLGSALTDLLVNLLERDLLFLLESEDGMRTSHPTECLTRRGRLVLLRLAEHISRPGTGYTDGQAGGEEPSERLALISGVQPSVLGRFQMEQ